MTRRLTVVAAVASLGLALGTSACGGSSGSGAAASSSSTSMSSTSGSGAVTGELTVFAAASLKKSFAKIGAAFTKAHPGARVTFSFAGSSDLVAQLQQGAAADVFASADTANMTKAVRDSLTAAPPVAFATNSLEIVVPPDNPAKVTALADLARPGVKVVLCAPVVPCGSAAAKVQAAAGIRIKPVSEEQSVTDVLGKVSSGEADAGLVYVTDVKGAGSTVKGVPFADSSKVVNTYPIAPLKSSRNAALAQAFVDAVTGELGQAVLADAGFGKAP